MFSPLTNEQPLNVDSTYQNAVATDSMCSASSGKELEAKSQLFIFTQLRGRLQPVGGGVDSGLRGKLSSVWE